LPNDQDQVPEQVHPRNNPLLTFVRALALGLSYHEAYYRHYSAEKYDNADVENFFASLGSKALL
jgi:hypothetical protein